MTRIATVVGLLALGIAVGACGGGAPAKSPAAESAPPAPGYAQSQYSQQTAGAAPPAAAPQAPATESTTSDSAAPRAGVAPSSAARDRDGTRDPSLRRAVEAAQRELDMAGSDCAAACRALGSMERATARLCTLEEASCEDVRVRLLRSRERVRTTCGGCPGGPSVNPDAPIPSR